MTQPPVEFWTGAGGDAYTLRNRVEWQERVPFWQRAMPRDARTVLEVGCNAGWNLRALSLVAKIRGREFKRLAGVDLNLSALEEARSLGIFDVARLEGRRVSAVYGKGSFELVFTAGVLIHVEHEALEETMHAIIDASSKYVMAIEYEAERLTALDYRGQEGKLWKAPYGSMYEGMGLKLVSVQDAGDGFDRCTAWLLEK